MFVKEVPIRKEKKEDAVWRLIQFTNEVLGKISIKSQVF